MRKMTRRAFCATSGAGVAGLAALAVPMAGCARQRAASAPQQGAKDTSAWGKAQPTEASDEASAWGKPHPTEAKAYDPAAPPARVIEAHPPGRQPARCRRRIVEAHIHYSVDNLDTCLRLMDANNIRYMVNHGLFWSNLAYNPRGDAYFFEALEKCKPHRDRFGLFYDFNWSECVTDPHYFDRAPDMLERAVEAGALGVKLWKNIGLTEKDADGRLIMPDDPRLLPLWERAERLGCIVSVHFADAARNFLPPSKPNARWNFSDRSVYPARETILAQRNNVFRMFPKVRINGCHMLVEGEDLTTLAAELEEFPNVHLDTSAQLGVLAGNNAPEALRDFFTKYQDRIMYGSDFTVEERHKWDSNGMADWVGAMYRQHWQFFQGTGLGPEGPDNAKPLPGIGLPEGVLRKVYWDNAYKFYGLDRFGVT